MEMTAFFIGLVCGAAPFIALLHWSLRITAMWKEAHRLRDESAKRWEANSNRWEAVAGEWMEIADGWKKKAIMWRDACSGSVGDSIDSSSP